MTIRKSRREFLQNTTMARVGLALSCAALEACASTNAYGGTYSIRHAGCLEQWWCNPPRTALLRMGPAVLSTSVGFGIC